MGSGGASKFPGLLGCTTSTATASTQPAEPQAQLSPGHAADPNRRTPPLQAPQQPRPRQPCRAPSPSCPLAACRWGGAPQPPLPAPPLAPAGLGSPMGALPPPALPWTARLNPALRRRRPQVTFHPAGAGGGAVEVGPWPSRDQAQLVCDVLAGELLIRGLCTCMPPSPFSHAPFLCPPRAPPRSQGGAGCGAPPHPAQPAPQAQPAGLACALRVSGARHCSSGTSTATSPCA